MPELGDRLGVVSSSGGFSGLPESVGESNKEFQRVYRQSEFCKTSGIMFDYLATIDIPSLSQDDRGQDILNQQCDNLGKTGMLPYRRISSLPRLTFAYLFKSEHYDDRKRAH